MTHERGPGRKHGRRLALAGAVALACGTPAVAHFVLMSPTNMIVQDPKGDPQKLAPCGGTSANAGTPSGAVTALKGGDMLHLKIQETVYHPGHYRVSLARTEAALPADPETLTKEGPKGPVSVSTLVAAKPVAPMLADGLFEHSEKPAAGSFWETDLKIPNIDCAHCVVQVTQWMGEHGFNRDGGYTYHHCATVDITRDPRLKADKLWTKLVRK